MKRIIGLMLTAVLAIATIGGCDSNKKAVAPVYADNIEMMLGGWDTPIPTVDDFIMAKEMGLTHMFIDEAFATRGTKAYEDILKICDTVGLKAIVSMGNAEQSQNTRVDNTDYSQYPAVTGINYWDEPWSNVFDQLGEFAEKHVEKYDGKLDYFVNLYPDTATGTFGGEDYIGYMKNFSEKALNKVTKGRKILSLDQYPLVTAGTGRNTLKGTYLYAIETLANQAKKIGADSHYYLQITEHYNYRAVSVEDLRFQFYTNMAFGAKSFTYFTYRDSYLNGFKQSCVDKSISCKANPPYYVAQAVNREIKKFDNVYLNFDWNGTMPVIGTNADLGAEEITNFESLKSPLEKIDCLSSVTAEENALIGQFKDGEGRDGLIVSNFNDPAKELSNSITLNFKSAKNAVVYVNGESKMYKLNKNQLTLEFKPGDGVFIIPLK